MKTKINMTGYKGFGRGLVCRGKKYAENVVFDEKQARPCNRGMHFCANPLDVFTFYGPVDGNEFAEVEALDEALTHDKIKYCTKKMKICAKLDLDGMIRAGVRFAFNKAESARATAATTGDWANAATTGDWANAATTGTDSIAAALGVGCAAKAALGCWIVIAERTETGELVRVMTAKVDGKEIKANTWYRVKNNRWIETKEEE